jgi:hypothetical protein
MRLARVVLNDNQRVALVSFIFNLGAGAFQASTLKQKLNRKEYQDAADQFLRWVHGNGRILPGAWWHRLTLGERRARVAQVVGHVGRNAELCGVAETCSGLCLDWTKLDRLPAHHRGAYSLLLAADVLYIQDIMPGFVEAALALLAPGGVMIVGHQTRRALVLDPATGTPMTLDRDVSFERFRALCHAGGLSLRQLGSRESPGFPGPLLMLAAAREAAALAPLPLVCPPLDALEHVPVAG